MNCQQARKYMGAFADGELDVHHNLEVLEHVNMCAPCAQRAEDVAQLRASLRRLWERESAPPELHARVRAAIANETPFDTATDAESLRPIPATAPTRKGLTGWLVPLTLAASVMAAVAVWQFWPESRMHRGTATLVFARAAEDVRVQHRQCVTRHGMNHHDESLSRDLPVIAKRLGERLGLNVLAPELAAYGYRLVGADRCGIQGRSGAHILYRSMTDGQMLSVFTVVRMAEMVPDGLTRLGGRDFYLDTDVDPNVVAWHEAIETHVVCARLAPSRLLEIAGDTRTATARPSYEANARLASLWAADFIPD